jgi:hypothetical protein
MRTPLLFALLLPATVLAQYAGGLGRGDGQLAFAGFNAQPFAGGNGRGDVVSAFTTSGTAAFIGGNGRGDVLLAFAGASASPFLGGNGRGDVQLVVTGPRNTPFAGGNGRGDVKLAVTGPANTPFAGGNGRGDVKLAFLLTKPLLKSRVVLEGPYDSSTGLMSDALRAAYWVPGTEPYTALGYPASNESGLSVTMIDSVLFRTGNDAIVDWVMVELRQAGTPSIVQLSRPALLQRDGDIVDMDGVSPIGFNQAPGNYHVVVKHRNHLGVMTASPVALGLSTLPLDLSSASTATYGTNARKSITGSFPVQALWAGDVTFNGGIKYTGSGNDRDPILVAVGSTTPNNVAVGYSGTDVNMNGEVKYTGSGNDRDPILVNVGSTTPNNVRTQQLP